MKVKKSRYHIWKNALVKDSSNLETVIKKLINTALQIVLVVGKENKLLGTITDGDIRRGLLSGLNINSSIVLSKQGFKVDILTSDAVNSNFYL